MACDSIFDLNPMCLPIKAAQAGVGATQTVTAGAFNSIANLFGQAANSAIAWLWQQIDDATTLDLTSPALAREMTMTGAIAATLCLALFLVQLIVATLRGHPPQLGRAVTGLLISFVGSAFALATTRILLGAVDSLSDGVVRYTMDTNLDGLSARFALGQLSGIQNPAVVILFAVVILCAVVMVWGAMMMIRKLMLVVAAVLAPIAFAGATADFARGWVRKWIEFVAAMIASKLLLVIILSIGVAVVNGAGQADTGGGQAPTQLAAGSLILLLGGFAPFMAIRMFQFAGDSLYAAHSVARQSAAGAQSAIAGPQKVAALHSQARALGMRSGGRSGAGSGPSMPPAPGRPAFAGWPAPSGLPGGTSGRAGMAASSGGAAAATSAAVPVLAGLSAACAGLKGAINQTTKAIDSAPSASSTSPGPSSAPGGGQPPSASPGQRAPPGGPPAQRPAPPPDEGNRS